MTKPICYLSIEQLQGEPYILLSDTQDTSAIIQLCGEVANEFDSFLVSINDGDYDEIWGFFGVVPSLDKIAYRIY